MPDKDEQPFCDIYGATSSSVLTEYLSPEEIIESSEEEHVSFLADKSRNRIKDISKTADLLKKAARDSYRLDKALYEPLNVSIASSFNCIETFKKEIKAIDTAIEREISILLDVRSVSGVLVLYLFCAIRLMIPIELPWTKEVSGGELYNKVYDMIRYKIPVGIGIHIYQVLLFIWIIGAVILLTRFFLQYFLKV